MNKEALNQFIDAVIEEEKIEFQPGIESFQMHADRVSQEITNTMQQFQTQYFHGFEAIAEALKEKGIELPVLSEKTLAVFDDPAAFQNALEQGKAVYELLEFSPDTMKHFFEAALDLVKKEDFSKAKDVFYFLVTIATATPAFWLGLGFCNAKLHNDEEARGAFRQAIDLDPKNGDAYLGCMNALINQHSAAEALEICEEGLSLTVAHKNEPWAASLHTLLEEAKSYVKGHWEVI